MKTIRNCLGWFVAGIAVLICTYPALAGRPQSSNPYGYQMSSASDGQGEFRGVAAVWPRDRIPSEAETPMAHPGDVLIVRLRNFDGWVIERLKNGSLSGKDANFPGGSDRFLQWCKDCEERGQSLAGSIEEGELYLRFLRSVAKGQPDLGYKKDGQKYLKYLQEMVPLYFQDNKKKWDALPQEQKSAGYEEPTERNVANLQIAKREEDLTVERQMMSALNEYVLKLSSELYPVLNQSPLPQIRPLTLRPTDTFVHGDNPEATNYEIAFPFNRFTGDEEAWDRLCCGHVWPYPVDFTLVLNHEGKPLPLDSRVGVNYQKISSRSGVIFSPYRPTYFGVAIAFIILTIATFSILAWKTDMMREPSARLRPDGRRQWSLARAQTAWWFIIILCTYLYLIAAKGDFSVLSQTAVILAGLSTATMAGAALVNSSRPDKEAIQNYNAEMGIRIGQQKVAIESMLLEEVQRCQEKLKTDLSSVNENELRRSQAEYQRQIDYLHLAGPIKFFKDLIGDDGEPTLHRFQMLIWTLALGLIFLYEVIFKLRMPDFPAEVLVLSGISAGTYVGFKANETKEKSDSQVPPNPPKKPRDPTGDGATNVDSL